MTQRLDFGRIWGGVVNYPAGTTFGPRELSSYELVWIIQGQSTYFVNGQSYDAPPGSIILARPGFREAYRWDPLKPTRHAYFHLDEVTFPDTWGDQAHWPIVKVMPEQDIIRPLFRFVMAQLSASRTATPIMVSSVQTLMEAFLLGPLSQQDESDPQLPVAVSRTLEFIRRTLDEQPAATVTLKQMAKAASVSPEHLCRVFREHLDMGPMETLRSFRLDRALGLIARSNLTIKEIAHRSGFASAYHFSRRFQQAYRYSPTQMRKRIAQGLPPPIHPLALRSTTLVRLARAGSPS